MMKRELDLDEEAEIKMRRIPPRYCAECLKRFTPIEVIKCGFCERVLCSFCFEKHECHGHKATAVECLWCGQHTELKESVKAPEGHHCQECFAEKPWMNN
jgi:hypothetical protein